MRRRRAVSDHIFAAPSHRFQSKTDLGKADMRDIDSEASARSSPRTPGLKSSRASFRGHRGGAAGAGRRGARGGERGRGGGDRGAGAGADGARADLRGEARDLQTEPVVREEPHLEWALGVRQRLLVQCRRQPPHGGEGCERLGGRPRERPPPALDRAHARCGAARAQVLGQKPRRHGDPRGVRGEAGDGGQQPASRRAAAAVHRAAALGQRQPRLRRGEPLPGDGLRPSACRAQRWGPA